MNFIERLVTPFTSVGFAGALRYLFVERFCRVFPRSLRKSLGLDVCKLTTPESKFPLSCRCDSSDRTVFSQIFIGREYSCIENLSSAQYIIDCGANVGYSSAYFLTRFPTARVIAVEPDDRNFEILQKNLAPYGERAKAIRCGIWSRKARLVVCKNQYRDGREWATRVRECEENETADTWGVDIAEILADAGWDRIDMLKMDIETAEFEVFSKNYESWIDKVGTFVVEIHNEHCREAFLKALSSGKFRFARSGELTIAQRIDETRSSQVH